MEESEKSLLASSVRSAVVEEIDVGEDDPGVQPAVEFPERPDEKPVVELLGKLDENCERVNVGEKSCCRFICQKLRNCPLQTFGVITFKYQRCRPLGWLNVRHFQIILISLLLSVVAMVSNIRLLIVLMNQSDSFYGEISDWSKWAQVWAHIIFFWGEIPIQFVAFFFISTFDKKWIVAVVMCFNCTLTCCIPLVVKFGGLWLFLIVRFVSGVLTGLLFVQFHILLNRWNIRKEKLMGYSMALSGTHLGHSMITILAPALYDTDHDWSTNFRLIAYWGFFVMLVWILWGYMSPDRCPYMSRREKQLMNEQKEIYDNAPFKLKTIPWKEIITNMPTISLLMAEMSYRFAFWIILAQVPMFFAGGFGYPLWKAGILSAIPHVIVWISCYPIGYTIQLFIRAKIISVTTARKSCSVAALIVGGIAFLLLGSAAETLLGAVTYYTVAVSLGMYHLMGGAVNHLDLAPRYSAVLFGIARGMSAFCAILAPLTTIETVGIDRHSWNIMFYITGGVSIFGGALHLIFGTAEVQDFNFHPP